MRQRSAAIAVILALVAIVLPSVAFAQGQGFMVRPLRLEVSAPPGAVVELPLEVRNILDTGPVDVVLRLAELTQGLDGEWQVIEPEQAQGVALDVSSREWASLSHDRATILPREPLEVIARVAVPSSARGVFFAALLAEAPRPAGAQGVAIRVRFLVPIIINVQGRSVRRDISLSDVLLADKTSVDGADTTHARLHIENKGRTFSRVSGEIRVEVGTEAGWRLVTIGKVPERGIVPGATIEIGADLLRSLPTGKYRLSGTMQVDGRRAGTIEKEVDFEGRPEAEVVAYDTTLSLSPDVVDVPMSPGAARTTTLRVENPGTLPLDVALVASTPRVLAAAEMGNIRGLDYSAAEWTEVRPASLHLLPGRSQNVRVVSTVPTDAAHPHYYADLVLSGTYADGQSAGETRSTIHLANSAVEAVARTTVENLEIAESGTDVVLSARLANIGNVAVQPTLRAEVLGKDRRPLVATALSGDAGLLLPLGKRTYSGDLALGTLAPGYYPVRIQAWLAGAESATFERTLLIEPPEVPGGAPLLTIVNGEDGNQSSTSEEAPDDTN